MKSADIVSVGVFFSVGGVCKPFGASGKFARKRFFASMDPHMYAHVFDARESFAAFSVNAQKWLLARVNPVVVNQFVTSSETAVITRATSPVTH